MAREALVVGINQYPFLKDTPTSKAKHLTTPASDAEAIAQLLETYGDFRVRRLPASVIDGKFQIDPNKTVTAKELEEEIAHLFLPNSDKTPQTALLLFAGHGLRKSIGSITQGFLATGDASPSKNLWGMSLRDLRDILQVSPVKQQIIWLDCCFSGDLLNFRETDLGGQDSGCDRFLIAASRDYEVAYGQLDGKYGVLAGALLQELDPYRVSHDEWLTNFKLADLVDTDLKKYYASAKIPQSHQISNHGEPIKLIQGRNKPQSNSQNSKAEKFFQVSDEPWETVKQFVPPSFELLDRKFFETQGQRGESRILKLRAATWSLIIQGNYIQRDQQDELQKIAEGLQSFNGISLLLIRGEPGAGKTALMRWLVYELFQQGKILLQKKTQNEDFSWLKKLQEFSEEIGEKHFYVIADDIFRDELMLDELGENQIQFPFTMIGTTRINEDRYESLDGLGYEIKILDVKPPSKAEKERILTKVSEEPDVKARLDALLPAEQKKLMAAPAMLVLMLQLSEGTTFAQKITEIIKKLPHTEQRPIYQIFGVICSFYQYGIIVPREVIPLCLPQFSLGAIQDIVDSIEGTELAGLVNTVPQVSSQGLGTIHELIAKTAIEQNYRPSFEDNPPYSRRSLERYMIAVLLSTDIKKAIVRSWIYHTLNRLATVEEAELVRLVLNDYPNQIHFLQSKCEINEWFLWIKIYNLVGLPSECERCVNKILLIEPQILSEWTDLLPLIGKFGNKQQKQEAITKTALYLSRNLDNTSVRNKYLAFVENWGNYEQKQKAILQISIWLPNYSDDTQVRSWYLKLINSSGTLEQKRDVFAQTVNWIQEHLDNIICNKYVNLIRNTDNSHVFSQFLKLLTELGTLEQKREAINQTAVWLKAHPQNRMVRLQYLDLVEKQGTQYQQQKAIDYTAAWLQEHPDSRYNRHRYLMLVEKIGTIEQQQRAIDDTAIWLQKHPHRRLVRSQYFVLLNKQGTCQQQQEAIQQTAAWLQDHPDSRSLRRWYLMLVERIGTIEQQQEAIQKTAGWLQDYPEDWSVRSQYLGLLNKQGTCQQQQEAIEKLASLLTELRSDAPYILAQYITLILRHGNPQQQQEAIERTINWLQVYPEHSDDLYIRAQYLKLILRQGTSQQRREAIEQAATWLQEHSEDEEQYIRNHYLSLVWQEGNSQQKQQAITQTVEWLQAHLERWKNPHTIAPLLVLLVQQGTPQQQNEAIEIILNRLQTYLDNWADLYVSQYLQLIKKQGTREQQQVTIEQVACWLQIHSAHPNHSGICSQYLDLVKSNGTQKQQEQAVNQTNTWLQIHENLDNQHRLTQILKGLGWLLQRMNRLSEAEKVFLRCQTICEELDDQDSLGRTLHGLGKVLGLQQKWYEAEKVLRLSYNLSLQLKDLWGQAMILNSVGQVLQKQGGDDKFGLAIAHFHQSIKVSKLLDNSEEHLAKVYTAMGKAYLEHGDTEQAVIELTKGFEIDINLKNIQGLKIVSHHLIDALIQMGRRNEALTYCQLTLAIAPNHKILLQLCERLSTPPKHGTIKKILHHPKGYLYGFITADDGSADIYFRQEAMACEVLAKLTIGTCVEVDVIIVANRLSAKKIRVV